MRKVAGWLLFWTAFGLVDWRLDRRHDGSTLSECTRVLFRTDTPAGRTIFTAAFATGAVVLHQHIIKPVVRVISS